MLTVESFSFQGQENNILNIKFKTNKIYTSNYLTPIDGGEFLLREEPRAIRKFVKFDFEIQGHFKILNWELFKFHQLK